MRKIIAAMLLCLFSVLNTGCHIGHREATPQASKIRRVVVFKANHGLSLEDTPAEARVTDQSVIEDRARIARIAAFLAAHSWAWGSPWWDTPDAPHFSFNLECDDGCTLHLGIGRNWIGDAWSPRYLSKREMGELADLLGLDDPD